MQYLHMDVFSLQECYLQPYWFELTGNILIHRSLFLKKRAFSRDSCYYVQQYVLYLRMCLIKK